MLTVNFLPFPVLNTKRFIMRQLVANDAQEIFNLRSNPRVMEFIARELLQTIDEATKVIERLNGGVATNDWLFWGLVPKGGDKLIGTTCLWNISKENYRAEIGYDLLPEFHGQGIMSEAIMAILDYGFNTMGLHSVEANVNPGNKASIKLLEKHGFVKEAHFKENVFFNGRFIDSAIYSLHNPNPVKPA